LSRAYKLRTGTKVWIAQVGLQTNLKNELEGLGIYSAPQNFGGEISFFALTVGDSTPPTP